MPWYYDNTVHKRNTNNQGFTIVELLIVVVVIAILAAISIVAYTGIQNRAHNSAVQSDLKSVATKLELYRAEFGTYPTNFSTLGISVTRSAYDTTVGIHAIPVFNLLVCRNADSTDMAIIVRAKGGDVFQYSGGGIRGYPGPVLSGDTVAICAAAGITAVTSPSASWTWLYRSDSGWVGWLN